MPAYAYCLRYRTVPRGIYFGTLSYFTIFGEVFSYFACMVLRIMLLYGTLPYWDGVLYMIVEGIVPSTCIITLFPYDTVRYGTVPAPYGIVINYGTVRYGTCTVLVP